MDKKTFIASLKGLKALHGKVEKVHLAMKELSPDFGGFYIEGHDGLVIDLLKESMGGDEGDWISYFIYELDWGKKAKKDSITDTDGKNIPIKTMSDLYNLVTKKYEKSNHNKNTK